MLNCEDKEEGYIDSDEDEKKTSPNKVFEKAFKNTSDMRQNAPPPTAIDPSNTQGNQFDQSMKHDAFNQSSVGMLKQEADYTPASQNLSLKKNSLIDINGLIETNENIRKAGIGFFNGNETPGKVELFLENNEKNENDSEKEMMKRSPNKINSIKSPTRKEENGNSEGFYLPNQVREERKDIFMQENSQVPENDEEFQRGGAMYTKKEKASSNPSETQPDMLFQKVSAKVAEII